jgi:hypothetical protein
MHNQNGCGLKTAGGYTIYIYGENFGTSSQTLYFAGTGYAAGGGRLTVVSSTLMTFLVPEGAGKAILCNCCDIFNILMHVGKDVSMYLVRGTVQSATFTFAYDPPYLVYVSPNNPSGVGDGACVYVV